ncbi:MAG: tripartite tricarboxylate transporter substrate binding protein [Variovorax sp.]|nr:MAG: tripartite tricarboxylate transporter substrate binding protein [Variovorax sp.]
MLNSCSRSSYTWNAACAALVLFTASSAHAWPDKPVRIVVPAVAGGTMDVVARLLSDQLSKDTGQTFFVDNKRGSGGNIAMAAMLSAPADGQTIMVAIDNILTEIPHVVKTNFDPLKDIKPVAAVARTDMVLIGNKDLPAKDVKGLVAHFKAAPGKWSFASYATGSASHYAGLMFAKHAGLDLQHVPFVGSPPALTQIMGGQVPIMVDGMVTSLPLIRAKKLSAYAVLGKTRSPLLPDVPTFTELGYPEIQFSNSAVVIVPSGVPEDVVEKIRAAAYKAASAPHVRTRMAELGFAPLAPQSIADVAKTVREEYERNGSIVKAFNIKPNE